MTETTDPVAAEIASHGAEATLLERDGRWVLTISRDLRQTSDRVWRALTEPDLLARWSPVVPDRPLTSVGPASGRESPEQPVVDLEVLVCHPPRELAHRWGDHLLSWTLAPSPAGCRLTLEQTFDVRAEAGMYGAGWHICLAVMTVQLEGHHAGRVVGSRAEDYGWRELRDRYDAALG